MADVFISYKQADRAWAERIGEALRAAGISCWRDESMVAGEQFNQAVDRELKDCRCVVVIWSEAAYASPWVQAEAVLGFERGILVAARADDVTLGNPFSVVQTVDLRTNGVEAVVEGVQLKLGAPVTVARKRGPSAAAIWAALCFIASMVLAVVALVGEVMEGDEIYDLALLGCWTLGVIGAIALFQAISRRGAFAAVLGGGIPASIAVTVSASFWNTAYSTFEEFGPAILPFPPGAALLAALVAFLVRRRG